MDKQYDSMTLVNLRELAKEKGLKNIAALKKGDLIELLKKAEDGDKLNDSPKADVIKEASKMQDSNSVQSVDKVDQKLVNENQRDVKVNQQTGSTNQRMERSKVIPKRADSATERINPRMEKPTQPQDRVQIVEKTGKTGESVIQQVEKDSPSIEKGILTTDGIQERAAAQMPFEVSSSTAQAAQSERKPGASNDMEQLDSGETKVGILEVLPDGYGFIRCDNYLPGENDVYVSPAQIRRFNLKTGDIVAGNTRIRSQNEKFSALLFVKTVNGFHPSEAQKRKRFEDLTPVFPNQRIHLETAGSGVSMRMVDLVSPIGKGQRGMIVSQPKTGKTTLLKQIAKAVTKNHPDMKLIILLIDERPEEVTDIKESIEGKNVEVIYSTFDELPDNHKRVSEMVIERAKRLVEHKQDVIILLDSITRLARAYNLTVQPSGRTLSGGLDPAALHMPKKFFGAARNMREGGSLTILATALVDTGSRMDDVVFEEFKGTGNMELVLDRSLSEKRIFPAIDLPRSSTRREDLLLTQPELEATYLMRKALGGMKSEEALERIIDMFLRTKTNIEFIETIKKTKIVF